MEGVAQMKSSPLQATYGTCEERIFLHAEIAALAAHTRATRISPSTPSLNRCVVTIMRLKCSGEVGLAMPCEGCWGALREFGVENFWWSEE